MNEYNILILSAGRRVELLECFRRAALRLSMISRITAVDASCLAPALYFADSHYLIPAIDREDYLEAVIRICKAEKISLVIPTIDSELLILSKNKDFIEENTGARVLVSDFPIIQLCRDKTLTQSFFDRNGFRAPKLLSMEDITQHRFQFPLFIKPANGSSSIHAYRINNHEELDFLLKYVPNPMVQEFCQGTEFTVDCFLDFDGKILSIAPRERLATRAGEILKGRIQKEQSIISEVARLLKALKPMGHVTIQCIKTEHGIFFLEINPRFGGGAPMSIQAGADSCDKLYRLLDGQALEYREDYMDQLTFLRFDSSIALDHDLNIVKINELVKGFENEAATCLCKNSWEAVERG